MNAWRQIADMSDARAYGSSASLGSTVFAVGGLQSDMQVGSAASAQYGRLALSWRMHTPHFCLAAQPCVFKRRC